MEKENKLTEKPPISDEKVVKIACGVDIIDILLNAIVAFITGSVVMLAETLQGVSDLVVDGLTYIGMKRAKRPPSEKHPFGYGREFYVYALFACLIMFFVLAGLSLYFGIQRLISPEPIRYIFLAYFVLIISFLTNGYSFSLAARRILSGLHFWQIKKMFSETTFLETKITFTSDLLGTMAAVFGLIALISFQKTGNLLFDALGAISIAFLMLIFSISLLKNVKDFIIGISAPEETKEKIKKAALEFKEVEEILDLKTIVIGSNRLLVNLEVHIQSGLITEEIELLIDKIKANIKKAVPSTHHIQVELETPDREI